MPVSATYFNIKFKGNTSQAVALWLPEKGCMRVVDSTNKDIIPISPFTQGAVAISDPSLIQNDTVPQNQLPLSEYVV